MSPTTFYTSREAHLLGSDRTLRRSKAAGSVVRVGTGVFVPTGEWKAMKPDERYRTRVRAISLRRSPTAQFSHDSAAALWRLPSLGPWPNVAHELTSPSLGGTSRVALRRHGLGLDPNPVVIDGVTVTSLARTLVDMSCSTSFARAVVMLDDALRTLRAGDPRFGMPASFVTVDEVVALLEQLLPYPGAVRARRAIEFANGRSGSAGESFSRVQFFALRLPAPELQVDFYDEKGYIGTVDFYWPELGLIGEFDGLSKYGELRLYQRDMTLKQILMDEKRREDRLRRVSRDFVRLDWPKIENRRVLSEFLRPHGLVAPSRARPSRA